MQTRVRRGLGWEGEEHGIAGEQELPFVGQNRAAEKQE